MTHEDLRKRAIKWLTNSVGCGAVLSEIVTTACQERPDAIGFKNNKSYLVECKVSRQDFLRNKEKVSVRSGSQIGLYRYFMIPGQDLFEGKKTESIVTNEDLEGSPYGLLKVRGNSVCVARRAEPCLERNIEGELGMTVSALRRIREREFLILVREPESESVETEPQA